MVEYYNFFVCDLLLRGKAILVVFFFFFFDSAVSVIIEVSNRLHVVFCKIFKVLGSDDF